MSATVSIIIIRIYKTNELAWFSTVSLNGVRMYAPQGALVALKGVLESYPFQLNPIVNCDQGTLAVLPFYHGGGGGGDMKG